MRPEEFLADCPSGILESWELSDSWALKQKHCLPCELSNTLFKHYRDDCLLLEFLDMHSDNGTFFLPSQPNTAYSHACIVCRAWRQENTEALYS